MFSQHPKCKFWSERNILKPNEVALNSHKKIWFDCECGHLFEIALNCLNKGIKPVIQKTISGKLIAEYISITEAGNKTNINLGSITQVCKGNRKNAGGYKWEYKK